MARTPRLKRDRAEMGSLAGKGKVEADGAGDRSESGATFGDRTGLGLGLGLALAGGVFA